MDVCLWVFPSFLMCLKKVLFTSDWCGHINIINPWWRMFVWFNKWNTILLGLLIHSVTLNSWESTHSRINTGSPSSNAVHKWGNCHSWILCVIHTAVAAVSEACWRHCFDMAHPIVMEAAGIWSSTDFFNFFSINFWPFYLKYFRILNFGISIGILTISKNVNNINDLRRMENHLFL